LAVVLAALRGVHGQEKVDAEVSLYDIANGCSPETDAFLVC
jgi:hypothetical protein